MINYISPSLLNSWLYCTHNENEDIQEFIDYLNRIEKPTTEAQQKGLDFEDEVYKGKVTIIPDTEDVEEAEAEAALEKELEAEDKNAEE